MEDSIGEENRRVRALRLCGDLTLHIIRSGEVSIAEADRHVAALRRVALRLFPDKGSTFDLVLLPRMRRAMEETYGI